jgi:hypothetical protein
LQALFAYRRSPVLIHLLRRFVTQTFTIWPLENQQISTQGNICLSWASPERSFP